MADRRTLAATSVSGITIPDSALCLAIMEFVRDTETDLLFNHLFRVFFFGAIAGRQCGLTFDPELLYFLSFECMIAAVTMPPILFVAFSFLFSPPR